MPRAQDHFSSSGVKCEWKRKATKATRSSPARAQALLVGRAKAGIGKLLALAVGDPTLKL